MCPLPPRAGRVCSFSSVFAPTAATPFRGSFSRPLYAPSPLVPTAFTAFIVSSKFPLPREGGNSSLKRLNLA